MLNNMKITFCTTCMGYTEYLKQTYLKNLEVAKDDKYDFVLVNYNSKDDMDDWVKTNLKDYIDNGKLKYYRTEEPKHWNMAHAKNVSHKLAEGDYFCNLDADNYLTKEFLEWVDSLIEKGEPFITRGIRHGNGGRVVIKKEDFYETKGYDERMDLIGDHQDLVRRVKRIGRRVYTVPNEDCPAIDQIDEEREKNAVFSLEEVKSKHAERSAVNMYETKSKQNSFGEIKVWL